MGLGLFSERKTSVGLIKLRSEVRKKTWEVWDYFKLLVANKKKQCVVVLLSPSVFDLNHQQREKDAERNNTK